MKNRKVLTVITAALLAASPLAESAISGLKPQTVRASSSDNNDVSAKRQALADAEKRLSDLKEQIKNKEQETDGAAGFFQQIANDSSASAAQKKDAERAYALLEGQEDKPSWYDSYVSLGSDTDATSLANFYQTLPYYDQFEKIRRANSLNTPEVSLEQIAVSMLDADYSSHIFDHANNDNSTGENLAWGSPDNPNSAWMAEEQTWNSAVAQDHSLARYKNDAYGLYQKDNNLYMQVGHYLNLINPAMEGYGYALNTRNDSTACFDYSSWDSGSYAAGDFQAAVTAYYDNIAEPDQVKAAKEQVKTAKADLQEAIKQSKQKKPVKKNTQKPKPKPSKKKPKQNKKRAAKPSRKRKKQSKRRHIRRTKRSNKARRANKKRRRTRRGVKRRVRKTRKTRRIRRRTPRLTDNAMIQLLAYATNDPIRINDSKEAKAEERAVKKIDSQKVNAWIKRYGKKNYHKVMNACSGNGKIPVSKARWARIGRKSYSIQRALNNKYPKLLPY